MEGIGIYTVKANFGDEYIETSPDSYEIRFQCPNCKKLGKKYTDYKLYVNSQSMTFNCFRCGWHGKLSNNFIKEGSDDKLSRSISKFFTEDKSDSIGLEDNDKVYYKIPLIVPTINDPGSEYLINRGISYDDILRYNIRVRGYNDDRSFCGRVIIPNEIIGDQWTDMYVSRTYLGDIPKYKNPLNSPKNKVVFNLYRQPDYSDQIIVCEGCLTAIAAGYDAVATYGKNMSDDQLELIRSKHPKKVYLAYDYDADPDNMIFVDKTQYKVDITIEKLLKLDTEVYWIKMPINKDALDVGREEFRNRYLREAVRVNSLVEYKLISRS